MAEIHENGTADPIEDKELRDVCDAIEVLADSLNEANDVEGCWMWRGFADGVKDIMDPPPGEYTSDYLKGRKAAKFATEVR